MCLMVDGGKTVGQVDGPTQRLVKDTDMGKSARPLVR